MSGDPWQRVPPAGPMGTQPTPRDSGLVVGALMNAWALDDLDALAVVIEGLEVDELRAALRMAANLARRALQEQPGGLELWQRAWRDRDTAGDAS